MQGDVTVQSNSVFSDNVAPPSFGDRFAYLTTRYYGSIGNSGGDFTGNGGNEFDITYMDVVFTAPQAGELSFFWNIITSEVIKKFPDPISITLDGTPLFQGAVNADNGSFPAITNWFSCDGGAGTSNACTDAYGEVYGHITPMSYVTGVGAGIHTLRFLVADEGDDRWLTGLVVDNITLDVQSVPEALPLFLSGVGILGFGAFSMKRHR